MPTIYQVRKVSDEGSSSPFIARLFMGLIHFRDQLYLIGMPEQEKRAAHDAFDRDFKPMFEAAQATRDAALEVARLAVSHTQRVQSGQAVTIRPSQYDILESVDIPLGQAFDKLIDQAIIATKSGLQTLLRDVLSLDIGFFFSKDQAFAEGIEQLRASGESQLADYLEEARSRWHSDLQDLRAKHEHEGWTLQGVSYSLIAQGKVSVQLPAVLGYRVDEYARLTANRVLLFTEDLVLY